MIDSFSGEYRFLSNMYLTPIVLWGFPWKSAEHAYQASKSTIFEEREIIRNTPSPFRAKKLGRLLTIRSGWENIRLDYMYIIVLAKFGQSRELRQKLSMTMGTELVEGNTWGDTFWGVCNNEGSNYLGQILMRVRRELT